MILSSHANLLAVRLDGPTKEMFAWALRVGFITYGVANGTPAVYKALEQKEMTNLREGYLSSEDFRRKWDEEYQSFLEVFKQTGVLK